jgi:formylglycine-generating enzyme required for sulfatase activity
MGKRSSNKKTVTTNKSKSTNAIAQEFVPVAADSGSLQRFKHLSTGTFWLQVPAGKCTCGLSKAEERAFLKFGGDPSLLKRMATHNETFNPFLMMESPIWHHVSAPLIGNPKDLLDRPTEYVSTDSACKVGYFTRKEATAVLDHFGWEFPSEAQWEYACRAGKSDQLFYFGDTAEDEEAIEPYVTLDPDEWKSNTWGFNGLCSGEWCAELYQEKKDDPPKNGVYVVRGGGSLFWPWQDTGEWVFCVSAMRLPNKDAAKWLALRPLLSIDLTVRQS